MLPYPQLGSHLWKPVLSDVLWAKAKRTPLNYWVELIDMHLGEAAGTGWVEIENLEFNI